MYNQYSSALAYSKRVQHENGIHFIAYSRMMNKQQSIFVLTP